MDTQEKICEAEVTDLARRIHAWQERGAIKTPALIRDFRGIGSEKTYRDLRNGNLDGYDCEQQLANYRAVWAEIEARDSRAAEEPVYDDLSAVQAVRLAALRAMRNTGINRVVIVLGGSGIGKSAALQALSLKYGSRGENIINEIRRVSKTGCRAYAAVGELPRPLQGLGISIVSTSSGVMSDRKAREMRVGGEVVATVC
jgi:ribosomal protein S8